MSKRFGECFVSCAFCILLFTGCSTVRLGGVEKTKAKGAIERSEIAERSVGLRGQRTDHPFVGLATTTLEKLKSGVEVEERTCRF